jgi:polyribonucleotide nucleotidyltransferase
MGVRAAFARTGASATLAFSAIPFQKTLAGVRVGYVDDEIVVNPTYEQRKRTTLDIVDAGSMDGLVIVEAGHAAIKSIVTIIDEMAAKIGKPKKVVAAACARHPGGARPPSPSFGFPSFGAAIGPPSTAS